MRVADKLLISSALTLLIVRALHAQGPDSILYKQVGSVALYLQVDYPQQFDPSLSYPAMVFFVGGGWNGGSVEQFAPHARYFASRGVICFRADYRLDMDMSALKTNTKISPRCIT